MWSERSDMLVFDSGRFFSLLVYCRLGAFSVSFLCSYSLVLNNLPVSPMYAAPQLFHLVHGFTLFFRFYIAFGCADIRLRVVWGRCGHPVLLQYPIKTLWCTFHVWDDDLASVVLVIFSRLVFLLVIYVKAQNGQPYLLRAPVKYSSSTFLSLSADVIVSHLFISVLTTSDF